MRIRTADQVILTTRRPDVRPSEPAARKCRRPVEPREQRAHVVVPDRLRLLRVRSHDMGEHVQPDALSASGCVSAARGPQYVGAPCDRVRHDDRAAHRAVASS